MIECNKLYCHRFRNCLALYLSNLRFILRFLSLSSNLQLFFLRTNMILGLNSLIEHRIEKYLQNVIDVKSYDYINIVND